MQGQNQKEHGYTTKDQRMFAVVHPEQEQKKHIYRNIETENNYVEKTFLNLVIISVANKA